MEAYKKGDCLKVAKFFSYCYDTTSATPHVLNNEICTKCKEVFHKYLEKGMISYATARN